MVFTADDHTFMNRALQLAEQGLFTTMPNPRVGCVIVRDGKIVGEGAHLKAGEPHAEVYAIRQAGLLAKGATAYVTLEPCSHVGRTPPCSEALVSAGITKVIAAMQDPNPLVAGRGLAYLQSHHIDVSSGLMQTQAEALNAGFISRMVQKKPFIRCKIAASLDGKTALQNDLSQWITSESSRLDVQHWRARSCAILTGIGTILSDNPSMTLRSIDIDRQPLKVVVDSHLQTPINAKILQGGNVLIAFAEDKYQQTVHLINAGAQLLCIPNDAGKVCLKTLLTHLAACEINDVMTEGGAGLNGALLSLGLVDELLMYYAPKIMGGAAKNMFNMASFTQMNQAIHLDVIEVRQVGVDIRLRAKPHFKI